MYCNRERDEEIWQKYNEGLKSDKSVNVIKRLAEEYYLTEGSMKVVIGKMRKSHGIIFCRGGQPNPERDSEIIYLGNNGMHFKDIAKKYGISRWRVSQIVHNARRAADPTYVAQKGRCPSKDIAQRNKTILDEYYLGHKNYVILAKEYFLSESRIRSIISEGRKAYEKVEI